MLGSIGRRVQAAVAALGTRRLALIAPVLVVAFVGAAVAMGGDDSTVQTTEEDTVDHPRLVSTSKGVSTSSKPTTTTAPVEPDVVQPPTAGVPLEEVPDSDSAFGSPGDGVAAQPPEPWPQGCCAPLTNLGFDSPYGPNGPAMAVKVSNAPQADPHTGLNRADLIYELRVIGVSRFIAVYHSRDVDVLGPIRSARTSDPPILAALGTPIVAYSGGNPRVYEVFDQRQADGFLMNARYNINSGWFFRTTDRVLPHNFYGHRNAIVEALGSRATPPTPQFTFLADGTRNASSTPASRIDVVVSGTKSSWTWDDASQMWLRSQYGRPHVNRENGAQIGRTSVIVLGTQYRPSTADARSPEAITVSGGPAWVLTGNTLTTGTWHRESERDTFELRDASDNPIGLLSGPVYVALTDVAPAVG
ncbi:MAG: DUF3048 domain-containing protein [Microthrixaceae bacterium]